MVEGSIDLSRRRGQQRRTRRRKTESAEGLGGGAGNRWLVFLHDLGEGFESVGIAVQTGSMTRRLADAGGQVGKQRSSGGPGRLAVDPRRAQTAFCREATAATVVSCRSRSTITGTAAAPILASRSVAWATTAGRGSARSMASRSGVI